MPNLPRRCDHVGSLLLPHHLDEARQRWRDGDRKCYRACDWQVCSGCRHGRNLVPHH